MNYKQWLNKYELEDNEENKFLYEHKGDMGFIFQEFQDACENGAISPKQKAAVLGVEVLDTNFGRLYYKERKNSVGKFYYYKLFDSEMTELDNLYQKEILETYRNMESLEDLVHSGYINSLAWNIDKKELINVVRETLNDYELEVEDYINKIGELYVVFNYGDL